jgi:DNA-binding transcriptional ArsR family regulator
MYRTKVAVRSEDLVYRAIAEPTRRAILDLLARGEQSVGWLAARFPISQPALSQHLRVLREAGLVRVRRQGRNRMYSIDAGPLRDVYRWTGRYRRSWLLHAGGRPGYASGGSTTEGRRNEL